MRMLRDDIVNDSARFVALSSINGIAGAYGQVRARALCLDMSGNANTACCASTHTP